MPAAKPWPWDLGPLGSRTKGEFARRFGKVPKGKTESQGDNYYRPVTFLAPSLGDVPGQTLVPDQWACRSRAGASFRSEAGELRPLSCYAFAKRWLLPSPLGGETLERTALCSLSST